MSHLSKFSDIVIPGANSTTDVQARISAGESIHVIKGSKGTCYRKLITSCIQNFSVPLLHHDVFSTTGTYIRTNDGRIFAIRSGKISRPTVGGSATSRGTNANLFSNPPRLRKSLLCVRSWLPLSLCTSAASSVCCHHDDQPASAIRLSLV